MERLDKQDLHGQKPVVTHVSKHNLIMFENQSKKNNPGSEQEQPGGGQPGFQPRNSFGHFNRFPMRFPPRMPMGFRPGMPPEMQQQFMGMPQAMPRFQQFRMPHENPMVRPPAGMMPGMMQGMMPQQPGMPGMPPVQQHVDPMMSGVPSSMQQHVVGSVADRPEFGGIPQVPKPGIAPHVNPAFLPHDGSGEMFGHPMGARMPMGGAGIPEADLESMRRNQAVASTAIQRAMADANVGDYESGIETLVTAISLIKQSSTANTESSQVLVQSLQDCLHSLEAQLMTKGKTDRDRDREGRSRSPSNEHRSDRRRRRHRSRSRSRSRDRRRSYSPRRSRSRDRRSRR
eukprot:Seg4089.4 transcript_id=Seg4089.4/GoldUCD/mRNA.D3Y31 product="Cleavage and polyadenylation specificity factor subunit 6" protein_id=Seg4089.4/GoldUCD/D3Y31